MRKEYWRPVVGYEGLYEVSNWGRIASLNYRGKKGWWHLLKLEKDTKNYSITRLYKNKKGSTKKVHLLVWKAFNGEIPEGLQVNHIDENKDNNCLWNLNLMTPKENSNWGTRNERVSKTCINHPARSKAVVAKDPITLKVVYEFPSVSEAARNGYCLDNISKCCNGKRKTHKGLIWQWA